MGIDACKFRAASSEKLVELGEVESAYTECTNAHARMQSSQEQLMQEARKAVDDITSMESDAIVLLCNDEAGSLAQKLKKLLCAVATLTRPEKHKPDVEWSEARLIISRSQDHLSTCAAALSKLLSDEPLDADAAKQFHPALGSVCTAIQAIDSGLRGAMHLVDSNSRCRETEAKMKQLKADGDAKRGVEDRRSKQLATELGEALVFVHAGDAATELST